MRKSFFVPFAVACILAGSTFILMHAQGKPTKIEGLDWEKVKRTEAQLQTLNLRYQAEAAPIVQEHDQIVSDYCKRAGLTTGANGDCVINPQTGEISKRPMQPAK